MIEKQNKYVIRNPHGEEAGFRVEDTLQQAVEVARGLSADEGGGFITSYEPLCRVICDGCGEVMQWGEDWDYFREEDTDAVIEEISDNGASCKDDVHICENCVSENKYLDLIILRDKEIKELHEKELETEKEVSVLLKEFANIIDFEKQLAGERYNDLCHKLRIFSDARVALDKLIKKSTPAPEGNATTTSGSLANKTPEA